MRPDTTTMEVVAGGSSVEAVAGAGAVVLGILGLAGILPTALAAIATIAAGAAVFVEGVAIAARWSDLVSHAESGRRATAEMEGGLTVEFLGGAAGIALGILGLVGVAPATLLPVAAIALGGTLVFSGGTPHQLDIAVERGQAPRETAKRVAHEAARASAGARVLVGLGAATLGIIGLVGGVATTLTLVAMLSVGAAELLSGGAITGRMVSVLRG